jgi:hypothetical protein
VLRAKAVTDRDPHDFSLVLGGPLYRLYLRTHLAKTSMELVHRRVLAFVLITWAPLAVLSAIDMRGSDAVTVPFFRDVAAHARLLIALPLLLLAEPVVHERVTGVARQFLDRRLIAPGDLRRFVALIASSVRLTNSGVLEIAILAVAAIGGHWMWMNQISLHVDTWYMEQGADGTRHATLAGRWYMFVSLPVFRFLLLRWYARLLFVWYRFLWLVSRMPLRLNALHPDQTGGLGFLNASVFAFVPVLVAQTTLTSALVAGRIWQEGATLPQFTNELVAVVAFLMLLVLLPQTFFAIQLERAWRAGIGQYGVLASRYVERFRQKWLCTHPLTHERLIGTSDIQSLADLANAFQVIRGMYLVPISKTTVVRLGLAVAAPLLPLTLTMIPFEAMLDRAMKMLI